MCMILCRKFWNCYGCIVYFFDYGFYGDFVLCSSCVDSINIFFGVSYRWIGRLCLYVGK